MHEQQPEPAECEAFNVTRQGMCKRPLTPQGDCPDALDHGDEFDVRSA